ncbi:MAG: CxxC-x17-CxxC domain-containing protein [Methanoculleaceae archaeon]
MNGRNFGGRRNFGPREMHRAICSDCGKECEVPFKPTEGRPVYCNECFAKHRRPRY